MKKPQVEPAAFMLMLYNYTKMPLPTGYIPDVRHQFSSFVMIVFIFFVFYANECIIFNTCKFLTK